MQDGKQVKRGKQGYAMFFSSIGGRGESAIQFCIEEVVLSTGEWRKKDKSTLIEQWEKK